MYLACTFRVPAIYPGPLSRRSRPSAGGGPLTVALDARRGPGRLSAPGRLRAGAVPALAPETAPAPGGRQVPLVFSACDSATRNAAAAVVNSGGSAPPAPPAPCQVTSQVNVAVAWKAPPGCPALELV